jgi:predicted RNA-binding protein YlxR (DUF448 family)
LIVSPGQPIRTCVGCGRKAPQRDLVRLKAEAGSVVFDRARTGGRGSWLHPAQACLDRALQRRAFPRVLRAQGVLADAESLRVELTGNARKH